jgi:Phosphotransferase enzyme family
MPSQANVVDDLKYRLILVLPESQKVLIVGTDTGDCLPSVHIPQGTRVARELQKAIRETWNLDVIVLDLSRPGSGELPCAVAEVRSLIRPATLRTVDVTSLMNFGLDEQLLAQLVSVLNGGPFSSSPFSRIGWIDQAIARLEAETGKRLSPNSKIDQYNAGGGFSLVHFRMEDESDYWLKATSEPNSHELAVTCLLSELAGEYLPRVISTNLAWNAWLMSGESAQGGEVAADPFPLLDNAVESMASLQVTTVGHRSNLLSVGAFDQSVAVFQQHSASLFNFLEKAMGLQTSAKAPRVQTARLREIRVIFEDTCRRMEDLDLPQTIIHGDLNWGNILPSQNHCLFLDWSEAYVGCPFVTLPHLLLLNQAEDPEKRPLLDAVLKDRYKRIWLRLCDETAIDEGFVYMPVLAIASALYGRCDWLSTSARDNPRRQVYARNLTRHLDRAARSPELLEALRCRSMLATS